MKSNLLLGTLVLTSTVHGYIVRPRTSFANLENVEKRDTPRTGRLPPVKYGKIADPPIAPPRRVFMMSDSRVPGVKKVKIYHGPYRVPNMNVTDFRGESGALENYPDRNVQKPCDECTIVRQVAGLEYPDMTNANIDTGMWLHHMVAFNIGPDRWDPTCYGRLSLPHLIVGTSPDRAERFFSSGNERSVAPFDILGKETSVGYHISKDDKFGNIIDLMNMNYEDKVVYVTMTYDIIEGPLPTGWKSGKLVWFDIFQCGTSELPAKKQTGSFTLTSGKWVPNFVGTPLGILGHMHDGGSSVKIMSGPSQLFCDSVAAYGEKPEFVNPMSSHDMPDHVAKKGGPVSATKHISSMTGCFAKEFNPATGISKGLDVSALSTDQSWFLEAQYDYDKNAGVVEHGKQSTVMGIALMFVAVEPGVKPLRRSSVGMISTFNPWA